MRQLLDTSICIPIINRDEPALSKKLLAATPGSVLLCSVVRAELEFGARNSKRVAINLDRVTRFCTNFESLAFDDDSAKHYGEIRAQLRREGAPIGANDLMIAAICVSNNVALVSRNEREFRRVPGLAIERW